MSVTPDKISISAQNFVWRLNPWNSRKYKSSSFVECIVQKLYFWWRHVKLIHRRTSNLPIIKNVQHGWTFLDGTVNFKTHTKNNIINNLTSKASFWTGVLQKEEKVYGVVPASTEARAPWATSYFLLTILIIITQVVYLFSVLLKNCGRSRGVWGIQSNALSRANLPMDTPRDCATTPKFTINPPPLPPNLDIKIKLMTPTFQNTFERSMKLWACQSDRPS